jgi:hypothetical protein
MNRSSNRILAIVCGGGWLLAGALACGQVPTAAGPSGAVGVESDMSLPNGVMPLTHGPLHEGFAQVVQPDVKLEDAIDIAPPAAVNEQPAEVRPDDPSAVWLPGYWGWDRGNKQFVWVSGVWRVPPPGFTWVPGYWTAESKAYRWVPGFWVAETTTEVAYLPEPPAYPEVDVDITSAPSDYFWVPGNYVYGNGAYNWEAGYWAQVVPDWIWIPSYYAWTPLGYVFVNGYWDLPFDQRGLAFAPVAFQAPVYQQPGYVYTPSLFLDLSLIFRNLFVGPGFGSYYFGDYYGDNFWQAGFYPWYAVGTGRYRYNPFFGYANWSLRRENPNWRDDFRRHYQRLARNPDLRPPRTWRDQLVIARRSGRDASDRLLAHSIQDALRDNRGAERLVRLSEVYRR